MVAKQKGGLSASTTCRELGVVAAAAGKKVVFIDADPQGTLRSWWNRRTEGMEGEPNPALAVPAPSEMVAALDQLRDSGVDLVIIDTPPSVHAFIGSLMKHVDFILLPTRPTTDDLDALPAILDLVEECGKPFAFLPTQVPPGKSRLYDDVLPVLAQRGRVAPPMRLRADFPVSAATGRTATEAAPKSKASEEIHAIWRFIAADLAKTGRKRARTTA
jgi:chromosome partitioning protein